MANPPCIANSNTDIGPEVTLWECPCRECWHLAQDALDDDEPRQTWGSWKAERTPFVPTPALDAFDRV